MEQKKNSRANLESRKPLFFLSGLALSLLVVIVALEWQSVYQPTLEPEEKPTVYTAGPIIPPTIWEKPKPAEKVDEPASEPVDPTDKFKPVDDTRPDDYKRTDIDLSGLDTIGWDNPDPALEIETVDMVVVERMAVPASCEGISDRSAQMECFNQWIQRYLAQNLSYPPRAAALGEEETLYLQFIISENGAVEEVQTVRGDNQDLVAEAERAIKAMPLFKPASQMGRAVRVRLTIPVRFKLR